MGKELARIEIPVYIRVVRMAEKRNKKFYVDGKKELPKKYLDKKRYNYKKKGVNMCLYDNVEHEFIIANSRSHGTPKDELINGQAIYNGYVSKWSRNTMMKAVKNNFQSFIETMTPIKKHPMRIIMEIHDLVDDPLCKGQLWDLGNRAFTYMKKYEDCLSGNKIQGKPTTKQIIPDDNVLFITGLQYKFIPIDGEEQKRKLVFIIEEEDDLRVLNHPKYKK